ncbi:MAG TPA: hypothetical protein VNG93_13650 [Candidatus Dormibacteraeota bacterium]|nr:hypothetical protein [Candidatus Dormibacteraeota bacterium]
MVVQDPRTRARFLFAAAVLGALLSQPGHLVGYLGHYGWRGVAVESHGIHSYFPSLLGTSLALTGALALVALLVAAGARLAIGRRRAPAVPFGQLLLVLLLVQLNVYAVQEMLELEYAGQSLTGSALAGIGAWGLAGQLPVALLGALALALLSSPLLTALGALRSPFSWAALPSFGGVLPALALVPSQAPAIALRGQRFPAAIPRRGPPPATC